MDWAIGPVIRFDEASNHFRWDYDLLLGLVNKWLNGEKLLIPSSVLLQKYLHILTIFHFLNTIFNYHHLRLSIDLQFPYASYYQICTYLIPIVLIANSKQIHTTTKHTAKA